ncbi:hypothetical protein B0H63DRAFT_539033 [Podospora didyma]|uniref:Uncharacterized protein n=1 Tax=Podospora didyma TaxID=330526 RepID=A0AAE0U4T7_9PEZI|nr:hypothetical protein B0H63DRAFT_539033 [Podospora didyma]
MTKLTRVQRACHQARDCPPQAQLGGRWNGRVASARRAGDGRRPLLPSRSLTAIIQYVRVHGGTAVLACGFAGASPHAMIGDFYAQAGFPWTRRSYFRTATRLQPEAMEHMAHNKPGFGGLVLPNNLDLAYSAKSSYLRNHGRVARGPFRRRHLRAHWAGLARERHGRGLRPHRRGLLGYVGDVNNETGSKKVILSMLGLLISEVEIPETQVMSLQFDPEQGKSVSAPMPSPSNGGSNNGNGSGNGSGGAGPAFQFTSEYNYQM